MKRNFLLKNALTLFLSLVFLFGICSSFSLARSKTGELFFEAETMLVIREPHSEFDLRVAAANLTADKPEIVLEKVIVTDGAGKTIKEEAVNKKLKNLTNKIEEGEVLRENLGLKKRDLYVRGKKLILSKKEAEGGLFLGNIELDLKAIKPDLKIGDETTLVVTGYFSTGKTQLAVTREMNILYSSTLPRPRDPRGGYWVAGDGHIHTKYSGLRDLIPPWLGVDDRAKAAASAGMGWINITDHAPNMSPDGQDWHNMVTDCGLATVDTGVVTLPGLELSTKDVDTRFSPPHDSHYLSYGIKNFIQQPPTLEERAREWDGQKVIDETNNNNPGLSFGAIAHPYNSFYPWFDYWPEASGYSSLELINGNDIVNPLTGDNWFGEREKTLYKWDELLKAGLSETMKTGRFVSALSNSDVHFGLRIFGQTVSYLRLPQSRGFSASDVNVARRAGRIVASMDGSLAFFSLNDGAIGDVVLVPQGDPLKIKIIAHPVDGKRVKLARLVSSYGETLAVRRFRLDEITGERYATVSITPGKGSDYPYPPQSSYFRVEVVFAKKGKTWTTYTNPIFVKQFRLPPIETDFPQGKAWRWSLSTPNLAAAGTPLTLDWAEVLSGDQIKGYIWFNKSTSIGYANLQFRAFDTTGNDLGAFGGTTLYPWALGWTHLEAQGIVPENASRISAELVVYDYRFGSVTIDIDAFRFINYRSYSYGRSQFEGPEDNPFVIQHPPESMSYVDVQYP